MKLLTALKRRPADNCVILTYNADLLFFEHMVFEPLYAAGCRNTLVLCDPLQYSMAVADIEQLRYAGQRYLLMPARTSLSGAFHPKLILLTSTEGGRLFLTSGNLTKAGFTRNWEVVTLFEFNAKKPDSTSWMAFQWAFESISQIVSTLDSDRLASQRLDQLWGTTPWLRQEPALPSSAPVWPLHNLEAPLLKQVVDHYRQDDDSPVTEAAIVSPFFDPNARVIARLLTECQPRRLLLYTQADTHGFNPRSLAAVVARHDTDFQLFHLSLEKRQLHAKSLLLRTERGAWLVTGSANFSRPAWLHAAATGNTEMVVLRFERDPSYFDTWLNELVAYAHPLELDWDAEVPEMVPAETAPKDQLTLLSATLEGRRLVLGLAERLPDDARLTVLLEGDGSRSVDYERWERGANYELRLQIPPRLLSLLEGPTLVTLKSSSSVGEWRSNPVLLHNLAVLRRFSRPIVRRERPRVPEGMVPESYEHCALLLEMIHDLLATNTEQLRRHQGRIASLSETDRQEKQMIVEEKGEYHPEDHFVDERVEVAVSLSSADLYADFHDRLTYEELLRAALAAVYHPTPEHSSEEEPGESHDAGGEPRQEPGSGETPGGPTISRPPRLPDDDAQRAQILARIERGFKRLVGSFLQGIADAEYLAHVPLEYLIELFVIITTYLRVVWRDGMLADKTFVDRSLDLLVAFWGQPRQPGAWQALQTRIADDLLAHVEERLALSAQTWLHAYSVAELLDQGGNRRVYDLAVWMRHLNIKPKVLTALPEALYRRLWRASFPNQVEFRPAAEVATRLHEISQWYDEDSLLTEISAWPGARAHKCEVDTAGLSQVPELSVTMPLSEDDLDRCLRAFLLFLAWPQPKHTARACFTNANPLEEEDDVRRVIAFYRGDDRSLVFGVQRKSEQYDPCIDVVGMKVQDICRVMSIDQLSAIGSIV